MESLFDGMKRSPQTCRIFIRFSRTTLLIVVVVEMGASRSIRGCAVALCLEMTDLAVYGQVNNHQTWGMSLSTIRFDHSMIANKWEVVGGEGQLRMSDLPSLPTILGRTSAALSAARAIFVIYGAASRGLEITHFPSRRNSSQWQQPRSEQIAERSSVLAVTMRAHIPLLFISGFLANVATAATTSQSSTTRNQSSHSSS